MTELPTPGRGLLATLIQRPVTVAVGVMLVMLFGFLAVFDLPIQLTPDISRPTLTVRTVWRGASPEEIEAQILNEQEEVLQSLAGLRRMEAEARPDEGSITLEFEVGSDIDEALVRAANQLSQVSNYPAEANLPSIDTANATGTPLAVIGIHSKHKGDVAAYRTWVEQRILPLLQRIPGVAAVRHLGGQDTELHIDFDAAELAARGIPLSQFVARVRAELKDISAGDLVMGKQRLLVRTLIAPEDAPEFERIIIGAGPTGTPIRLGDVAKARFGLRKPASIAMNNNRPSMILLLSREAGTNVLEVSEAIRRTVKQLNQTTFAREGLEISVLSDQTDYINRALKLVQQNLLLGAVLASLVLLFFLRSVRAALVITIAIPICALGTALGMQLVGRTVNIVSLAGITFAIGMVVDNSIVALEVIYSERAAGASPLQAAYQGIKRVWGALLASTATTAVVFIPVIGWQDEVGQLLRDIAVAISVAIVLSFLVSVWVIPSFAAKLLAKGQGKERFVRLAAWGGQMRSRIVSWVGWLIAKPSRTVVAVVLSMAGAGLTTWVLLPPLEYLPSGNRNLVFGILVPPPGVSVQELEQVGSKIQGELIKHTGRRAGKGVAIDRSFFVGSPAQLFSGGVAQDPSRVKELLGLVQRVHETVPGMLSFTTQASLFGNSVGGSRNIDVEIIGNDLGQLTMVGGQFFGAVRTLMPGAQVRPLPSLDPGGPEIHWYPRRDEAAGLAIDPEQLGLLINAYADGAIIGELSMSGKSLVDVVVRGANRSGGLFEDVQDLKSAPVVSAAGAQTTLDVMAEPREELGPTIIRRIERQRSIGIRVVPPDEIALETAIEMIKTRVIAPLQDKKQVPAGVNVELSGTASDLDIAGDRFGAVLLLALLICFLVMAALYEDFIAPLVILVTIPLAAAGGVVGLFLVNKFLSPQPLDLLTAIGFLILIGVVVNNAILVVDESLALLRQGLPLNQAVVEGTRSRVRPIFMTTCTSLAGLLPMVLFPGSGSELYRGVGAIVLGGLTLSTVLTLFLVPSLFALVWRVRYGTALSAGEST